MGSCKLSSQDSSTNNTTCWQGTKSESKLQSRNSDPSTPFGTPISLLPHSCSTKPTMAIHFVLIQNRQGKTRLSKWYNDYNDAERKKVKTQVHQLVAARDQKFQSNFVEFHEHKIVYRRYAGLFFCMCVDVADNELFYLEAIHMFVEILDTFFGSVRELDIVFNFHKVYAALDEIVLDGEIQETSAKVVLTRLEELEARS